MHENFQMLKTHISEVYTHNKKAYEDLFTKSYDGFKSQCEQAVSKFQSLPAALYIDALQEIKEIQMRKQSEFDQHFRDLMSTLEKQYKDTVKQLTAKTEPIEPLPLVSVSQENNPSTSTAGAANPPKTT